METRKNSGPLVPDGGAVAVRAGLADREPARALGRERLRNRLPRRVEQLLQADAERRRKVQHASGRVEPEPAADRQALAAVDRDVEAVDEAGTARARAELGEPAQVVLLQPERVRAQELSVVVVEPGENRARGNLLIAGGLEPESELRGCSGVDRHRSLLYVNIWT